MREADIAKHWGRHESTIRRELVRNRGGRGYRPKQVQALADVRSVSEAMLELLNPVKQMVATMTYDNGKEFAMHESVNTAIECESFFADPYCSWQRGTNENTNGLIRQYVPTGRHFSTLTHEEVQITAAHFVLESALGLSCTVSSKCM